MISKTNTILLYNNEKSMAKGGWVGFGGGSYRTIFQEQTVRKCPSSFSRIDEGPILLSEEESRR